MLNEDPVDLQFQQSGYLFLANEDVAHIMEENYRTQRSLSFTPPAEHQKCRNQFLLQMLFNRDVVVLLQERWSQSFTSLSDTNKGEISLD